MNFPFRQVHLDFHTSGSIPAVGEQFNADEFKKTLTDAAVDSISLFGVCHHGYCYYPSKIGTTHPALKFDLLGEQIKAAKSAGIRTQIYISVGFNDLVAAKHPEWLDVPQDDDCRRSSKNFEPGFKKFCLNQDDYFDYVAELTKECISRYPENDGVFFDICFQFSCCCQKCTADILAKGQDPRIFENRRALADEALDRSFAKLYNAVKSVNPDLAVFFNNNDMLFRRPALQKYFTHFEIESLPTGAWGYDFFPLNVGGARTNGKPVAGMTGKFHLSWGEFGGVKHPNALRYECSAMLAYGAKCNVGDQLHPCGKLDETTYNIIGTAFREVKSKEPWCESAVNRAEIAMISGLAAGTENCGNSDVGLSRLLLESHFLFDNLHPEQDFSKYKIVIFPENYYVDSVMQKRIEKYMAQGGKVVFAGDCIMNLPFDTGAEVCGKNELDPTYMLPIPEFRADFVSTPYVVYSSNILLKIKDGISLGDVYDSYFNRDFMHFCSHLHTPNKTEKSDYVCGVIKNNLAVLAYPVFSLYRRNGSAVERLFFEKFILKLLDGKPLVKSNMPSVGRVALTVDEKNQREIVHLLYAPIVKRGENVEIIEDLTPLCNIECEIAALKEVKSVRLVPENRILDFEKTLNGVKFKLDSFVCHAMIELAYAD